MNLEQFATEGWEHLIRISGLYGEFATQFNKPGEHTIDPELLETKWATWSAEHDLDLQYRKYCHYLHVTIVKLYGLDEEFAAEFVVQEPLEEIEGVEFKHEQPYVRPDSTNTDWVEYKHAIPAMLLWMTERSIPLRVADARADLVNTWSSTMETITYQPGEHILITDAGDFIIIDQLVIYQVLKPFTVDATMVLEARGPEQTLTMQLAPFVKDGTLHPIRLTTHHFDLQFSTRVKPKG